MHQTSFHFLASSNNPTRPSSCYSWNDTLTINQKAGKDVQAFCLYLVVGFAFRPFGVDKLCTYRVLESMNSTCRTPKISHIVPVKERLVKVTMMTTTIILHIIMIRLMIMIMIKLLLVVFIFYHLNKISACGQFIMIDWHVTLIVF